MFSKQKLVRIICWNVVPESQQLSNWIEREMLPAWNRESNEPFLLVFCEIDINMMLKLQQKMQDSLNVWKAKARKSY